MQFWKQASRGTILRNIFKFRPVVQEMLFKESLTDGIRMPDEE